MIVDAHAHAFPYLGSASGYDSVSTHLGYIQRATSPNANDPWSQFVHEGGPLPPDRDVGFRVGEYGKVEWTVDGQESFLRLMSPGVFDMAWPPERMVAFMDWVGVDVGVLHGSHMYGLLNYYHAEYVRMYPDRFVGIAQINELEGDQRIGELRHAVEVSGLCALFYDIPSAPGYALDDERWFPLWEEAVRLDIPVIFQLGNRTAAGFSDVVGRLERVMEGFPRLQGVLAVMGGNMRDPRDPEHVDNPEGLLGLLSLPNMWYETGYVLAFDRFEEYPYPTGQEIMRRVHEETGAERMVWGSDVPFLMRTCTYRQGLDFIRRHCDFLSEKEKRLVLGENAARLYKIKT